VNAPYRPVPAARGAALLLASLLLLAPAPGGAASPCENCPQGKGAAPTAGAKAPAAAPDPLAELARAKKRVVIADFGQGLCKQCKKQGAILEEVKKAYGDKVEVRFVHVAKESALAERYGVNMIPHLVYIDPTGKACQADTGVSSFEKIADRLAKLGVRR
jgi:thiol-disulfide isomerase/thioredoxin